MKKESKIYVAGSGGMVGSAIVRELKNRGYENIIEKTHAGLDLTDSRSTDDFFRNEKPEYVFLAAAKVGGIAANNGSPDEFLYENMMIEMNTISAASENNCKKLLFLGSSCIYPREAPQPIKEDALLSGRLEKTNEGYAIAKIAGLKFCEYLNTRRGKNFISVMPTNLYGIGDNYHPMDSHVVPALIRRFHNAKETGLPEVVCWGDGTPKREFLFADDLAGMCVEAMLRYSSAEPLNLGSGEEVTVAELAKMIKQVVGYRGRIKWDSSMPNGTPQKRLDNSKAEALGLRAATTLADGLEISYRDFLQRNEG